MTRTVRHFVRSHRTPSGEVRYYGFFTNSERMERFIKMQNPWNFTVDELSFVVGAEDLVEVLGLEPLAIQGVPSKVPGLNDVLVDPFHPEHLNDRALYHVEMFHGTVQSEPYPVFSTPLICSPQFFPVGVPFAFGGRSVDGFHSAHVYAMDAEEAGRVATHNYARWLTRTTVAM